MNSQQRNVWSSVRRIIFQILGVKGLMKHLAVTIFMGIYFNIEGWVVQNTIKLSQG